MSNRKKELSAYAYAYAKNYNFKLMDCHKSYKGKLMFVQVIQIKKVGEALFTWSYN